jgi:hypothetical protein
MVFNVTFNNISVISWRSVLLVEETGENHLPVASHWQTLSHNAYMPTLPIYAVVYRIFKSSTTYQFLKKKGKKNYRELFICWLFL